MPRQDRLSPRRLRQAAISRSAAVFGMTPVNWQTLESIRRPEWVYRSHGRVPTATLEFRAPVPPTDADRALCRRLIDAYTAATGDAPASAQTTGMWSWIFDNRQRPLADALQRQDSEALADLLASMFQHEFVVGMAAGSLVEHARSRVGRRVWTLKAMDGLVSLGEALGVLPAETPEQGMPGRALANGLPAVVGSIEDHLGAPFGFPNLGAPFGLVAGSALIPIDWPEQAYAATRLRTAIAAVLPAPADAHVVEIGAGYGGMAYWFLRLEPSVRRYTIVDLPIVGVLHGYFLSKTLGDSTVSLYGEEPRRVVVVPSTALDTVAVPADVVVNKDSMPEMPAETVDEYLAWSHRAQARLFFSYNQEASAAFAGETQNSVPDAIARSGCFSRVRRDASWLRRGYVEEIYVP